MPLTILLVSHPLVPVGPDSVGEAEQLVSRIDDALSDAGHCSILVAPEETLCRGDLVVTPALGEREIERAREHHRRAIGRALQWYPVDIVHMHGVDFDRYLPPPGVPVLVTLHAPPADYAPGVFRLDRPSTFLHCTSDARRAACPESGSLLPTVEPTGEAFLDAYVRVLRFSRLAGQLTPILGRLQRSAS